VEQDIGDTQEARRENVSKFQAIGDVDWQEISSEFRRQNSICGHVSSCRFRTQVPFSLSNAKAVNVECNGFFIQDKPDEKFRMECRSFHWRIVGGRQRYIILVDNKGPVIFAGRNCLSPFRV
jgi:hypothetical protein